MGALTPLHQCLWPGFVLVFVVFAPISGQGATLTWNGGGASDDTSLSANWGGSTPATGDLLHFAGTIRLAPNQVAALSIGSLTFDSGADAFTLGGNTYTISTAAGVTNNSTNTETINNAITLGIAQTWSATSGNLVFGGNVANGGFLLTIGGSSNTNISGIISGTGGLTKNGSGTLTLAASNTFSGGATLNGGTTIVYGGSLGASGSAATINAATLDVAATVSSSRNFTLGSASSTIMVDPTLTFTASGVFSGTGALNKSGAGTMVLSGTNTYSGATAITAGVLNIQSNAALGTTAGGTTVSSGAALQIQGSITVGNEALTLNGNGVSNDGALRNISGTNSMSGAVTLGSAITLGSDAGTLTLSGAFNNGGFLLTETGAGNITLSGVVSGTGGLTMNGSGTLTLGGTAANTFSGTTTVNSGVLALNKTATIDAIAGSLVVGDNVNPAGTATVRLLVANQIDDASAVTVNTSGVLDWNGVDEKVGALTLYSGTTAGASVTTGAGKIHATNTITLAVSGTGAVGATISGNMADGGSARTIFVNDGAADADLTISAVMQGSKGYIKDGAGRLVLSGANTATGTFTINTGSLQIQNVSALSSATGVTVNSGGALELVGGLTFNAFLLTLNGSGVNGTGALLNVSGTNSFAGALTIGSATTFGSDSGSLTLSDTFANAGFLLTATGAGNLNFSGVISGTGGLTKNGTGILTLSGGAANTYSGATTVNDGELDLNKATTKNAFNGPLTVGDGTGSANSAITRWLASNEVPAIAVTVNSDGCLDLNNFSDSITTLTMTSGAVTTGSGVLTLGGTVTGNASSNSATISGNLALGANRIFTIADGAATQDMNVSAVVSGAFTVTKNGTGTMVFSGANTYTGATTVSAGVLNVQHATGLGTTAAGTTVSSGATLQLQGGITVGAETLNINGTGASGQTGALVNVSGTNTYGGLLTLAGATTLASDSGTLNLTNTGTITGATFGLTLAGAGDGSISSIIGTTSGAVTKNGAGAWTLTGVNTYTGGTTINGGTLVVNSSLSLGAITGGLLINAGTLEIATGYSTTRAITLGDAASTFQVDASQTFTDTTAIGGSGSLNKTGAGTMVLGATETYTGSTNVSAGTLQINASNRIVDTSALTVSGGTFDLQTFNETVAGVTLSGGSITGSGGATLTGSSYTLQSGSASAVLAGGGTITKNTSGTVTLTGNNTMSGAVTVSAGTLTLAAGSGNSALGSVSSIAVNSGGTLLLGAIDQINNSATMSLGGGTFAKGNFSEGTLSSVGVGALTLTTTGSHVDFGSGTVGVLTFASLNAAGFTLTIDNWTGTYNHVGDGSTDRLIFDSDQAGNLNNFFFTGYGANAVEFNLGGGYWEVVAAVPEPSTWVGAALSVGGLLYWHIRYGRRRLRIRPRHTNEPGDSLGQQ